MTVQQQPSAKAYAAQVARITAIRAHIAGTDYLLSHALGGLALNLLTGVLDRAASAPAGSLERISSYAEMLAIPSLP